MIIDQELIKWNLKDNSANLNAEFENSAVWRGKIHETSFLLCIGAEQSGVVPRRGGSQDEETRRKM